MPTYYQIHHVADFHQEIISKRTDFALDTGELLSDCETSDEGRDDAHCGED